MGQERTSGRRRYPFTLHQTIAVSLIILAVVFILQNRRTTTIRFLIPEVNAPLWVALFVAALLGMAAGALLTRDRRR